MHICKRIFTSQLHAYICNTIKVAPVKIINVQRLTLVQKFYGIDLSIPWGEHATQYPAELKSHTTVFSY